MLLLQVLLTSQPVLLERTLASQSLRVWPRAQSQRYHSTFYCLWSRHCYLFMQPEGQGPYPPGMDLGTQGCIWHQDTGTPTSLHQGLPLPGEACL